VKLGAGLPTASKLFREHKHPVMAREEDEVVSQISFNCVS
jgi:hypothetical protein